MSTRVFGLSATVALMALPAVAFSQSPEFHHLHGGRIGGVFFLDDDMGWTAEDGARVRRTLDGGTTWAYGRTEDEFREELTDVFFIGESDGWAVSASGSVLRSLDGGDNWEKINTDPAVILDQETNPAHLNTIFMLDDTNGWVGGDAGTLFVTADGGISWDVPPDVPGGFTMSGPEDCHKIFFWNSDDGYMAGGQWHAYSTDDGGDNWTEIDVNLNLCSLLEENDPITGHQTEVLNFDFGDSLTEGLLVAGLTNQGMVLATDDAGASWFPVSCYEEPPAVGCYTATNFGVARVDTWPSCVAVGQLSQTLVNEAGADVGLDQCDCVGGPTDCPSGYSLRNVEPSSGDFRQTLFDIARIGTTSKLCFVGNFGILRRVETTSAPTYSFSDEGTTYYERLEGGQFLDDQVGCVIGQGYVIRRTTDGGVNWPKVYPSGTPSSTDWGRDIAFSTSGQYGVAVGDVGFTAYSVNYGVSWTPNTSGSSNYQSVAFIPGTDDVLIGGVGGILKKSINGGSTWSSAISVGTSETIAAIDFADANVGYLVGTGGAAYKTTDAGATWSAVSLSPSSSTDLYGVATWGNGTPAAAVGAGGKVYGKTASQFVQLNPGAMSVSSNLTDVEVFPDGSDVHVRICGLDGVMLFADGPPGSLTWTQPKSQTNDHHSAISFLSADEGFGIGRSFLITKYD